MNDNRIDELESRIAHQDKTIADLNDVVMAQWRKIEGLELQLKRLGDEMQDMALGPVAVEKPPHY